MSPGMDSPDVRKNSQGGKEPRKVTGKRQSVDTAQVMYGFSPAWSLHVDTAPNRCSGWSGFMAGRGVVGVVCKKHSQMSEEKMV